MRLQASEIKMERGGQKVRVEKLKRDGELVTFYAGKFIDHTDYSACARRLGVDEQDVVEVVDNTYRKGKAPAIVELGLAAKPKPVFRVRNETGSKVRTVDDMQMALQIATGEQVIEWDNTDWVCCLDIDFGDNDKYKPSAGQLLQFCDTLHPIPIVYWLSRSEGMHLIYTASEMFDASELAAVAGYQIKRRFPNAAVEFLHRTRMAPGAMQWRTPDNDTGSLRSLLLQSTECDSTAWLAERGWSVGDRKEHSECPVDPSNAAANNPPVVVREDHVMCYVCAKNGKTCGSKKPGVFTYAALSGGRVATQIAMCVKHFVHWGHAKHVFHSQLADEQLSRRVYSCLLKMHHGDDPRIPQVFTAGEPNGLVRYDGYWCDYRGKPIVLEKGSAILKQLPHCQTLNRNGSLSTDQATCEWLTQTTDQDVRGYVPITPIYGVLMTQFQTLPANKVYNVLQNATLSGEEMQSRRPTYQAENQRMPVDDAWGVMATVFPKIDRTLIELLLVGRGCIEHRAGLPPMLFVTGHTGVGKTSHMIVAAAIAGDSVTPVHLNRDRDRFNNELLTAKRHSGFVFFDEFFKFAKQAGQSDVEAMQNLLAFTDDSLVYMIYIGSVSMGSLPLFIWADTEIPQEVQSHEQIGRRVFHYELNQTLDWETPLAEHGIGEPKYLRTNGSVELVQAANSILSHVIDTHFTGTVTDFAQVAEGYGLKRLRDSAAVGDKYNLIRELFVAVCNAPAITDASDKKRFSPPGFKVCKRDSSEPLWQAFELCQSQDEKDTLSCRAISEADLTRALGIKQAARLEIRRHGAKYALRFVSIDGKKVNGELA